GKSRESTQSAGLFTALSVWTVARKRQLAAWRGGFMQQRHPAAQSRLLANRFIPIPKFVLLSDTGNWPGRWSSNQPGVCPLQLIKRY
ncbi:hypothetical protein, partial [Ralstonia pseudosolanacearum]|uniref:hypothetical protein n=1 Tax=Ralstonia pseudosolanacearum TaxID=1310165 RepID=UPI001E48F0CB